MNQQLPAYLLLIIIAAVVAFGYLVKWIRGMKALLDSLDGHAKACAIQARGMADSVERETVAITAFTAAITVISEKLGPAAEALKTNMTGVPVLLENVAKVGSMQVELMKSQRDHPFGKTTSANPQRDRALAEREHFISQTMASEGISREEALLRINPANGESVWGQGQRSTGVFDGW